MFTELFAERGLSLDRLRAFVEAAAAGGIAKAAPGDPVRQSQISRQIKDLEEFFAAELFSRRGRGMVLTATGKELLWRAQAHLASLADLKRVCGRAPVRVRIGAGDGLLQWLIIPAAASIRASLGDALIEVANLRSHDVLLRLAECSIDFGIVRAEAVGPNLRKRALGAVAHALFVPAGLLGRRPKPDAEWVLRNVPLACHSPTGTLWAALEGWAKKRGFAVCPRLVCESLPQAAQAVRAGSFAAVLPDGMAADFPPAAVVRVTLPIPKVSERPLALCWNPSLERLRPALANATDAMVETFTAIIRPRRDS